MIEYREDDDISYLDLENWINDENNSAINAIIDFSVLVKGIKFMTFKSFQKALKSSGEILVMQMHTYFDLEGHLITKINNSRYPKRILEEINKEIQKHNDEVARLNWRDPTGIHIYFVHNGVLMYYSGWNDHFYGIDDAETALELIKDEVSDRYSESELNKMEKEDDDERKAEIDLVTKSILEDKGFHECTNHSLRSMYLDELLKKHPEYREKLRYGGFGKLTNYIDYVWKIYKSR